MTIKTIFCQCNEPATMTCCLCGVATCNDCGSDLTDEAKNDYCIPCSEDHFQMTNGVTMTFSTPFETCLIDENGQRVDKI